MIWTFENKVHLKTFKNRYLFFNFFFLTFFLQLCYFCFNMSYIESLLDNPKIIHKQKYICIKPQTKYQSIFFNFKNPIIYI